MQNKIQNITGELLYQGIASGIKNLLEYKDTLDEIKVCIRYELNGEKIDYLPAASEDQFNIKPVYKTFPGWTFFFVQDNSDW